MPEVLSVYDGAHRVGELEEHGRRQVEAFVFIGKNRASVGIFPSRIEAMRAISGRLLPPKEEPAAR